ncbi:E3 ubiquitin-protein ligase RNF14-like [Homarus americanus]|uniref:E3 ubiquitin-protein ligase RNF14-like n=1 Tax=Homarus americanus TaxID=6706 RepID=UPI001C46C9BA|nr:E3 ubiquitin-protein ligase RNF14-like [Homarus americanus]
MSLDTEEQDDELLALASIYEDSFTSVQDQEADPTETQQDFSRGGELAICLELPPEFGLLTRHNGDNGEMQEQRHVVEHLPPIYLHFTYPATYPSKHPPSFTLSCKWLNRSQLTLLCQQLDKLWAENEGCVVMFTWAQILKDESLDLLGLTDTLDLDNIRPIRQPASVTNDCGLVAAGNGHGDTCGAISKSFGDVTCDNSVSDSNNGGGDSDGGASSLSLSRQNSQNYDSRTIQDIAPKTNMLRLLRDYDEEMRRQVFGTKNFECKVCFADKLGTNCLEFWPCRHVYCKDCMASYFTVQISEGNIQFLRCPEIKCDSEANPKQVQELVPEDLYQKWDQMLLNSTLSSLGDIQPCPRYHCQYPVTIEEGQGQCPSCKFVFCGICRFGWHGVDPCRLKHSESRKIMELYINGEESERKLLEDQYGKKYLSLLQDEYLSLNYLEKNSKKCPRCQAKIEKIDGCNKMTCQRCSIYFCWLCMCMLNKARPYEHYNDPHSPCFNSLFAGMAEDDDIWDDSDDEMGALLE